jgi:hypothetical protein
MSIIRNINRVMILTRGKRMMQGICCLLVFFAADLAAQCEFRENGYYFKHPYFTGVNWQATMYQTDLLPVETMCAEKPKLLSVQQLPQKAVMVYTTATGAWNVVTAPLVNNTCVCCLPTIEYSEPVAIAIPAGIALDTALPFHVLTRSIALSDTTLLAATGKNGMVYCLHVITASGTVTRTDSFTVELTGQQAISGLWGEPDGNGVDTAVWIGGSRGLLQLLPYKNNQWGTIRTITFDNNESVTSVGSGFVGTASGKIYRRSGTSFSVDNSAASSPVRSVNARIAVGDAGTVLVRRNGVWRAFKLGTADYRGGNLTGNAQGAAVELLDETWSYSVQSLSDSATSISSVSPSEVAVGLRTGVYPFALNGTMTVSVNLRDPDDNRGLPELKIRKRMGGVATLIPDSAITQLSRHDPAAICTTTQAYFNDSIVKVNLYGSKIQLQANGIRGYYNASCSFWKWQPCKYSASSVWAEYDTALTISGKDTLRIVNHSFSTVTAHSSKAGGYVRRGMTVAANDHRIRIVVDEKTSVRNVSFIDISGKLIGQYRLTGSTARVFESPVLPRGIILVRVEYANGVVETVRFSVADR